MARHDEFVVDTLTAVQRFFGVSRTATKEWKNADMPVREDGRYDLKAIYDWWLAGEKFKYAVTAGESRRVDPGDLETMKLQIDVDHRRLKLERERGSLVSREAAKAAVTQMFHRVRSRLLSAPEELASSLPAEIRAGYIPDAKHRVSLILREMEMWSFEKEVEDGGDGSA